jgi:hypothetical protein
MGIFRMGVALTLALCMSVAQAQRVPASAVTTISVEVRGTAKSVVCYGSLAGTSRDLGEEVKFTSYSVSLKKLKKRLVCAGQDPRKVARYKRLAALRKAGNTACRALNGDGGTVSPTPTPASTSGPSATDYYEDSLNLTELGKQAFGIPSGFSASYSAGSSKFDSKGCGGSNCYGGTLGKRYRDTLSGMRTAVSRSPMNFTEAELSDEDLADIMTYLRFGTCTLCR